MKNIEREYGREGVGDETLVKYVYLIVGHRFAQRKMHSAKIEDGHGSTKMEWENRHSDDHDASL